MGFASFYVPSLEYFLELFKAEFSLYETVFTEQTTPAAMSFLHSTDNSKEFLISW